MPTSIQYALIGTVVLLLAYDFWQQRKISRLMQAPTSNKETLSWVDYRGYHYNIEINREVHSAGA